jgi:predicted nucleotidyltransferase
MMALDPEHVRKARQGLVRREEERRSRNRQLHAQAVHDSRAIVDMIVQQFNPDRVYQWGSVLRPERFRDYSDIDIAVEGITQPEAYFDLLGKAQAMTTLPVDIVQLEKVEPEFAESIRTEGRVVYERQPRGGGTTAGTDP